MNKHTKTFEDGFTFSVETGFQNTDKQPGLKYIFQVEDPSGNEIGLRQWDERIIKEFKRVEDAFKRNGFNESTGETGSGIFNPETGVLVTQMGGIYHSSYTSQQHLEGAAHHIMGSVGYKEEVIEKPRSFVQRTEKAEANVSVNMQALRSEIEDKVTAAMGTNADAMRLSAELGDLVHKHVRGTGRGKADD